MAPVNKNQLLIQGFFVGLLSHHFFFQRRLTSGKLQGVKWMLSKRTVVEM